MRNSGESVSHYVATLKHLATECKFGEAMPTERLHDRLVSGICDSKMITEFLKVKLADLSFDLVVQKCLTIEQANKDVQVLQGEQGPGTPVNELDTAKTGEEQASPKSPPKTEGFRGKDTYQASPKSPPKTEGFRDKDTYQASPKSPPKTEGFRGKETLRSLNLATVARDHITHKSAPS